ncbi:MAG TPA: prepilin-type N-terminal cleavage/methylation domain-containing protein [Tepidisphaeraceae bacterium]|jgi:prepilin-type N-terminal cleavage/methylation domain-containing protein
MRRRAFTFAELLIVIMIIAVLIALLTPMIARAWEQARQVQCMSNIRQVTQAVLQYAADADGQFLRLDRNHAQLGLAGDEANSEVILPLNQFLHSSAVFHCPSDPRDKRLSYSISDYLGGTWPSYTHRAKRVLDVTNPATTFAVIEETDFFPKVSNDPGGFVVEPPGTALAFVWQDAPAVLHGDGTCITFVDGHCEYWVWQDARTRTLSAQKHGTQTPDNPDLTRLQAASGGQ